MIYFVLAGLLFAMVGRRNPLSIVWTLSFKFPFLFLGAFGIQMLIALSDWSFLLSHRAGLMNITFFMILVGLFINRQIGGIRWILIGVLCNFLALVIHGGEMPVSEEAMRIAMIQDPTFEGDSRHQAMMDTAFWWLGDWIPFKSPLGPRYVYSLGDLIVGIGLIRFLWANSLRRGQKQ